jgi:hypothetical protein
MQYTVQAYEISSRGRQLVCEAIAMEQRDARGFLEFPDATEPLSGYRDLDWAMAMRIIADEWAMTREQMIAEARKHRARHIGRRFSD